MKHRLAVAVLVLVPVAVSAQQVLDHFQCYGVKRAAFPTQNVTVHDQFGTLAETVSRPEQLCVATDANGEGIADETDHLSDHAVRSGDFTTRRSQTVVDQFGTLLLDVTRPRGLLVPTSKDGVPQQPPLDHFQCYRVKRSKGGPTFDERTVSIANQMETTTVTLVEPVALCAPADKNGEDPSAPAHPDHLLCYRTRGERFGEATHTITSQFGTRSIRLIERRELCVPALKNPAATLPGRIVVANDEWTLSNHGFALAPDTGRFALNVATFFTGGSPGNFLAFSSNFGLTEWQLAFTMTTAGHAWKVSTTEDFSLPNLLQYDAIFVAADSADGAFVATSPAGNQVLIEYVRAGGNVYVAGGTGFDDAAAWNAFLRAYGLELSPEYNGISGTLGLSSTHPLFSGVGALYQNNGNMARALDPTSPDTSILLGGLYAAFSP